MPACNLGPGDSELAHQADERVERAALDRTFAALLEVLQA
jgi:acetylornithine deacetylase/succinyl-diaminopimelate desuccinylase-like protein